MGSGHCCHTEVFGTADGPGSWCRPIDADMVHTPDGSEAAKLKGHGSPGGFQTHSPGLVWNQRLPDPSGVRFGLWLSLAVNLTEVKLIRPAPVHDEATQSTSYPQYPLDKVGSVRVVDPFGQNVDPPPE